MKKEREYNGDIYERHANYGMIYSALKVDRFFPFQTTFASALMLTGSTLSKSHALSEPFISLYLTPLEVKDLRNKMSF